MATVNGVALSQSNFGKVLQANAAQGQKDSPQLHQTLMTELIPHELLSQKSAKRDKSLHPSKVAT